MLLDTIDGVIWKMDRLHAKENPPAAHELVQDAIKSTSSPDIPAGGVVETIKKEVEGALDF